jgi:hypothetical protein
MSLQAGFNWLSVLSNGGVLCILLRTFELHNAGIFIHGLNTHNYEFFKKDPADTDFLTFKYLF